MLSWLVWILLLEASVKQSFFSLIWFGDNISTQKQENNTKYNRKIKYLLLLLMYLLLLFLFLLFWIGNIQTHTSGMKSWNFYHWTIPIDHNNRVQNVNNTWHFKKIFGKNAPNQIFMKQKSRFSIFIKNNKKIKTLLKLLIKIVFKFKIKV